MYRPIDIARLLGLSTSALRHYESWGVVPKPERRSNGYRVYTEEHYRYFAYVRALNAGFGMAMAKQVLVLIQRRQTDEALWRMNEAQAALHRDRMIVEKAIRTLDAGPSSDLDARGRRHRFSIGQVSAETTIPTSAIRHWEKMGLLELPRDPDNGYRYFTRTDVRKVLLIGTLRTAVSSLEVIRHMLRELGDRDTDRALQIAKDSMVHLNRMNRNQLRGANEVFLLCRHLGLIGDEKPCE